MDIFKLHGGVVDEHADRQGKAAERHCIHCFAAQVEYEERGKDRQRDGDANHQRAAPTAEEKQDHQRGEHGGDAGFVQYVVNGVAHEDGLIE